MTTRKRAPRTLPMLTTYAGDRDSRPGQSVTLFRRHDTPTLPILNAVNALWREIQANNPGTPNVSIVLQASEHSHGHFAPGSWATATGESMHELMLSTVSLALATNDGGVIKTVSTLLHEAAHAYAYANGLKDTSRQGRYHNGTFKTLAERFGCAVQPHPAIGHVTDGISNAARVLYAPHIEALMEAVTVYRRSAGFDLSGLFGTLTGGHSGPVARKPRKAYGSDSLTIICECPSEGYRIPKALYNTATLHCNDCESDYIWKQGR
jgi:hypothetical protein